MRLTAKGLQAALGVIERVERVGGVRDWIALAVQVDGWVVHDQPIALGGDAVHAEPGYPLGIDPGSGRALWLLEGARLMIGPADGAGDEAYVVYDLADAPLPREAITARLRHGLLSGYAAQLDLTAKGGLALQSAVGDLLALAGDVDARSRGVLLAALAEAVAAGPVERWAALAPRLRVGFERALADRDPAVLAVAVGALVRLAVVGPLPPGEPRAGARMLTTLFNVPRSDIHAAALSALAALDPAALAAVADVVRPLADAALASADPSVRRAAGDVELRLRSKGAGGPSDAPAGTGDAADMARWLRSLAVEGEAMIVWLPRVLEAFDDADAQVRRAALAAVDPVLGGAAGDGRLRQRVVESLLAAADPALVAAGLAAVDDPAHPLDDAAAAAALSRALEGASDTSRLGGQDGAGELRGAIVARLAARYAKRPVDVAADGFEALLRHRDGAVRAATLEALAGLGGARVRLRDLLTHAVFEQLREGPPEVRVAAGRAVLALGFPNGAATVVQAVVDPDARVRAGLLDALRATAGDDERLREAERMARAVDVLCRGTASVEGDERVRWTAALGEIVERRGPRTVALLLAVLATIPPAAVDPFLQFAIAEIDRHLVALAREPGDGGGESLVSMCRRLLDGPTPQPVHAARLAGERVSEDDEAFAFLWTMATAGLPGHAAAARKALARLTQVPKSPAVLRAIASAYWATDDPARRDVLRGWYGGVPRR